MKKIKCVIYSRVVGYYSNTEEWNRGKKEEFVERKNYIINGDCNVENKDIEISN